MKLDWNHVLRQLRQQRVPEDSGIDLCVGLGRYIRDQPTTAIVVPDDSDNLLNSWSIFERSLYFAQLYRKPRSLTWLSRRPRQSSLPLGRSRPRSPVR